MKWIIKVLSFVAPSLIANIAFKKLTTPKQYPLRNSEIKFLETAVQHTLNFNNYSIKIYNWQGGDKKVLLIHGWEGQAGNFAQLAPYLVKQGFNVFAFDGPSHGASSKGATSLIEFSNCTAHIIQHFNINTLISHSFGSVATVFALGTHKNIHINKFVLLTAPDRFMQRIDFVAKQVGMGNTAKKKVLKKLHTISGYNPESLNVSDFAPNTNVQQALIIHDKNDKQVPLFQSESVHNNWPKSTLQIVENTGHFRMLRSHNVFETIRNFLKD